MNIPVVSPLNFSGLFPFGIAEGDQFGPRGDDSATDPVILDIPFTFFGKEYTEIIVSMHNIIRMIMHALNYMELSLTVAVHNAMLNHSATSCLF